MSFTDDMRRHEELRLSGLKAQSQWLVENMAGFSLADSGGVSDASSGRQPGDEFLVQPTLGGLTPGIGGAK